uniref:cytochrome c oxidase subunit II n=1 Tax=Teredothyra matocotana TaxID=2795841 RepID=UPI0020288016|nr:cytochrome c oxidase subunit II [Teredothyra matocotana]UPX89338.1 cytochrome c oxidase subunit 2 [Teredothyra matocotana]
MVESGKYGFLDPMTENCSRLISYHDMVMVVGVGVMAIVIYFLMFALYRQWFLTGYSCRFKTKCNWLEFCWTFIPGIILGVLGYFSWENLYLMELTDKADYHVKVTGHQWYWEYEYYMDSSNSLENDGEMDLPITSLPLKCQKKAVKLLMKFHTLLMDEGAFQIMPVLKIAMSMLGDIHLSYDSYNVDLKGVLEEATDSGVEVLPFLGQNAANQVLYLPHGKMTEVTVCTADVMHSWGVSALGVKMDAVPGRANHLGINPYRVGYAYGNCYELCGYGHGVMPITVLVLPEEEFMSSLIAMVWRALAD